jgi:hypothetical protein
VDIDLVAVIIRNEDSHASLAMLDTSNSEVPLQGVDIEPQPGRLLTSGFIRAKVAHRLQRQISYLQAGL